MDRGFDAGTYHPDAAADVLREAGTLDSTIHHELLHMLIDSYARGARPVVP